MNDLAGIIWAHRSDVNLGDLTRPRNTCSIPFGGQYRLVDFMLSNYINAGIDNVGMIVHESYQSLLDHVGNGKEWDLSRKQGGLRILPPFGNVRSGGGAYRGSIDALSSALGYLQNIRQEHVIVAWGDIAANLDVSAIFKQHLDTSADITIVATPVTPQAKTKNYITLDENGQVIDFEPYCVDPENRLRSLQVYVLSKKLLLEIIEYCTSHNQYSFSLDGVLPRLHSLKVMPYLHKGFSTHLHSVINYFKYSMDLLDPAVRADLFNPDRPIATKDQTNASTYHSPTGSSSNCLLADGCHISGTLTNCILSRGVIVEEGATVSNSILMQGTIIKAGAKISHVITDKNVEVTANRKLMGHSTCPLVIEKNSIV
ncbi:MAG: glucose-1-phosphate adenylyltransferase subunit GlgD [Eubacteriales bacterium]